MWVISVLPLFDAFESKLLKELFDSERYTFNVHSLNQHSSFTHSQTIIHHSLNRRDSPLQPRAFLLFAQRQLILQHLGFACRQRIAAHHNHKSNHEHRACKTSVRASRWPCLLIQSVEAHNHFCFFARLVEFVGRQLFAVW